MEDAPIDGRVDFAQAITSLRANAARMRRYTSYYTVFMTATIATMIVFMAIRAMSPANPVFPIKYPQYAQWNSEIMTDGVIAMAGKDARLRIEKLLNAQFEKQVKGDDTGVDETHRKVVSELTQLSQIHKAIDEMYANDLRPKPEQKDVDNDGPVSAAIGATILSLGVAAMALYFIQLSFRFIRYYSRLAELYSSQEAALIASQGRVDVAIQFIQAFSPNDIDVGGLPRTFVEKLIDATADLAKRNGK